MLVDFAESPLGESIGKRWGCGGVLGSVGSRGVRSTCGSMSMIGCCLVGSDSSMCAKVKSQGVGGEGTAACVEMALHRHSACRRLV